MAFKHVIGATLCALLAISATGEVLAKNPQTPKPLSAAGAKHPSGARQQAKNNKEEYAAPKPAQIVNGSVTGFVYQLPGKRPDGINADYLLAPASTMKVLTAAAALTKLGPSWQFETKVSLAKGDLVSSWKQGNVLKNNVVITFTGAPDLSSAMLKKLLERSISGKGIKKIEGDVILDTSLFAGYDRGNGWPWDDLPLCFTAPAGAIVIDHNCVVTSVSLKKRQPNFTVPVFGPYQPIKINMDTYFVNDEEYNPGVCAMRVVPSTDNVYRITGCLGRNANAKKDYVQGFKFAVQNPDKWGEDIVRAMFAQMGVTVTGKVRASNHEAPSGEMLGKLNSAPLSKLLSHTLKFSDNLYAEEIARAVGRAVKKRAVTMEQSAGAVRKILTDAAGVDFKGAALYDGSGLSSYTIVPASAMLQVLKYVRDKDARLGMIDLLPVSGVSGTLIKRRSTALAPLKYNVIAKTGTIRNVRNLAGFVKSKNGNLIPFVIFENSMNPDKEELADMERNKELLPHFEFEKNVLRYLYEEQRPVITGTK